MHADMSNAVDISPVADLSATQQGVDVVQSVFVFSQ